MPAKKKAKASSKKAEEPNQPEAAPEEEEESSSEEESSDDGLLTLQHPSKEGKEGKKRKKPDSKKKKKKDDDDDDDDDDDTINVDFEFHDTRESDFHTIKTLLKGYNSISDFAISEFADLISAQGSVGTTIKTESCENEPIGFISALSMHFHSKTKCMQQLKTYMLKHAPKKQRCNLEKLFKDTKKPLGLLVQGRMVNSPAQLIGPMHTALQGDLEWAIKNDSEKELRKEFKFENVLLIARRFADKQKGKNKSGLDKYNQGLESFRYFDEGVFASQSSFQFAFPMPAKETSSEIDAVAQEYVVMCVEAKKIPQIIKQVSVACLPSLWD